MQSFVYRSSEFEGSHTDADKSAQNKEARFCFAFPFNISESWQRVASFSPRFVTPTWLLVVLADVFRCSKGCNLAEKLGISIPDPSGASSLKSVSCSSSPSSLTPILCLPFSLPLQCSYFPYWSSADLTSFCFCEISASPECLAAIFHIGLAPERAPALWQPCVKLHHLTNILRLKLELLSVAGRRWSQLPVAAFDPWVLAHILLQKPA